MQNRRLGVSLLHGKPLKKKGKEGNGTIEKRTVKRVGGNIIPKISTFRVGSRGLIHGLNPGDYVVAKLETPIRPGKVGLSGLGDIL